MKLLERVRREVVDVINDLVGGSGSSFVDLLKAFGIEEDDMEYEGFGLLSPLADEKFVLRGGRGAAGGVARDIRCLVGIERMERREEGSNIDINHVRLGFEDPSILAVVVTYFMKFFHVVRCVNVFRDGIIYEDMPGVYLWIDLENDGYIVKVVLSLWGVMKIEEEVRKFREVEEAEGAVEVCMERFGRRLRKKGAEEDGGAVVVGGEEKQEDEVVVRVRARVMEKTASKVVKRGNGGGPAPPAAAKVVTAKPPPPKKGGGPRPPPKRVSGGARPPPPKPKPKPEKEKEKAEKVDDTKEKGHIITNPFGNIF